MSISPGISRRFRDGILVRVVKLGISMVFFSLTAARDRVCRWLGERRSGRCVVLYYHCVPNQYRDRFEQQMRMLARNATVVDLSKTNGVPADIHAVALTFDDGLQSFVDNGVPVLLRLKLRATLFVVAGALGGRPLWGREYFLPDERVISAEQLISLPDLVTVGSHTLSHPNLVQLAANAADREIRGSLQVLQDLLGRPVKLFSFPHGAFNDATVRQCREAGYERVFTTEPTLAFANSSDFVVGRVSVDPWDWRLEFRLKVLGAYRWQAQTHELRWKLRRSFSRIRVTRMPAQKSATPRCQ